MTLPTQFEIDERRQTARQAALGQFVGAIDTHNKNAQTKRQEALAMQDRALKLREMGYDVTPEMVAQNVAEEPSGLAKFFGAESPERVDLYGKRTAEYEAGQKQKAEDRKLEKEFKESQINKNNRYVPKTSSVATNPDGTPMTWEQKKRRELELTAEQNSKLDREKKLSDAQIADFDIADPNQVIPTTKDAEEIKVANSANKTFQSAGARAISKIEKFNGPDAFLRPNDFASLEQDVSEMRVQAKELARLGALTGPDLDLVDSQLGSINRSTLSILGPQKAAARVKEALKTANEKLANAATSRGYRSRTANKSDAGGEKVFGILNNALASGDPMEAHRQLMTIPREERIKAAKEAAARKKAQ